MFEIILINFLRLIIAISNFYLFAMFFLAIMSFLMIFGVINITDSNSILTRLYFILRSLINPLTNFFARFLPQIGMIDLSFLVLIFVLYIIRDLATLWIVNIQSSTFMF